MIAVLACEVKREITATSDIRSVFQNSCVPPLELLVNLNRLQWVYADSNTPCQRGLFTQVILSEVKDLRRHRVGEILRCVQNDRKTALIMNDPGQREALAPVRGRSATVQSTTTTARRGGMHRRDTVVAKIWGRRDLGTGKMTDDHDRRAHGAFHALSRGIHMREKLAAASRTRNMDWHCLALYPHELAQHV